MNVTGSYKAARRPIDADALHPDVFATLEIKWKIRVCVDRAAPDAAPMRRSQSVLSFVKLQTCFVVVYSLSAVANSSILMHASTATNTASIFYRKSRQRAIASYPTKYMQQGLLRPNNIGEGEARSEETQTIKSVPGTRLVTKDCDFSPKKKGEIAFKNRLSRWLHIAHDRHRLFFLFRSKTITNSRTQDVDRTDLDGLSNEEPPSSTWTVGDTLDSSKTILAEAPSAPRDTTKPLNLVEAISDVALKKIDENDGDMAIRIGGRELYRATNRRLGNQESRVHSFAVVNHPPIFSVDLKVGGATHVERELWPVVRFVGTVVSS